MVAVLSLHKVTAMPEPPFHLGRPGKSPGLQRGRAKKSPVPGWGRALSRGPAFRVGRGEAGHGYWDKEPTSPLL